MRAALDSGSIIRNSVDIMMVDSCLVVFFWGIEVNSDVDHESFVPRNKKSRGYQGGRRGGESSGSSGSSGSRMV